MVRTLLLVYILIFNASFADAQIFGFGGPQKPAPEKAYLSKQAQASQAPESCDSTTTSTPPFYVASNDGRSQGLASQTMRNFQVEGASTYVPANSIVRPLQEASRFNIDRMLGTDFVNVEVTAPANTGLAETARTARTSVRNAVIPRFKDSRGSWRNGTVATAGQRGWILRAELERTKAKDYTFLVKSNAPLLQIPGGEIAIAGRPIRLAMEGNGYRINRCCPSNAGVVDRLKGTGCHDNYVFEILNPEQTCVERTVEIAGQNACTSLSNYLLPVKNDQAKALGVIAYASSTLGRGSEHLELIDSRGQVKFPFNPTRVRSPAGEYQRGPFNSYHYSPDRQNDDAFMNTTSACALGRVLEQFAKECKTPGCEVGLGDFYHGHKGREPEWGVHASHDKGTCVDVRPLGNSTTYGGRRWNGGDYNRMKTARLIELFIKAGAKTSQLAFNDTHREMTAVMQRNGVNLQRWANHDDHIHVCFPHDAETGPEWPKVHKTCKEGLNPPARPRAATAQPGILQQAVGGMFGFVPPSTPACR